MKYSIDLNLEKKCTWCGGTKTQWAGGECHECDEDGMELTDLGRDILDLVKRRLLDKKEGDK